MAQTNCTYSCSSIARQLTALDLPFASVIARCLVALLSCRKATIQQVANLLPGVSAGKSPTEAKRQEIRRLLDQPALVGECWAKVLASLLPKGPWILALDRTKWNVGKTATVNLLTLAIVCFGCAVPIFWLPLDKAGCSDTDERIILMNRFLTLFGAKSIRFLTADREFIGSDWIYYLLSHKIPFRIRIKAGEFLESLEGQEKRAGEWFSRRACRCKPHKMWLWGMQVFVGGTRLGLNGAKNRSDYLIVISNEKGDLLGDYRLRWKIETLFHALKGRGFEMEASRLTQDTRLSAWFGFLALALAWCLKAGEFIQKTQPVTLKKHGRPEKSIFNTGMSALQRVLAPLAGNQAAETFYAFVNLLQEAKHV